MEENSKYDSLYFIGAGGIGMAALERYFLAKGYRVAGYDRTCTALTDALAREGVEMCYDESAGLIPEYCRDPRHTLVVYTPAIPDSHEGLRYFRAGGFEVMKRAQVLGLITRNSRGLCFSGTHGKTTTSSMAAHILHNSAIGCSAFLGGIMRNYGSNFLLDKHSDYTVIEADEYDRSFHWLHPFVAVVTATDPDHLDIYGTEEAYLESFSHFTELIDPEGILIVHKGLKFTPRPAPGVRVFTYSRSEGDFHAEDVRCGDGEIIFDLVLPTGRKVRDIKLGVPVDINIENAIAAMAVCHLIGAGDDELRNGIATYQGTKRRFEFWMKEPGEHGRVVIDDYAHHPDELKASIESVRKLYPGRKLTVAFQPHLYSRTRDFYHQFAEALSMADEAIVLDIYPAREEPLPGVTADLIFDEIGKGPSSKVRTKVRCQVRDLADVLASRQYDSELDVLLTAGAGDICDYLPDICKALKGER